MKRVADKAVIEQLQKQILKLQGNQHLSEGQLKPLGLGLLESAFPDKVFPKGVIHELISTSSEEAVCTSGFIGVVLSKLMPITGYCLWISTIPRRSIFPPSLKAFGIDPEKLLFVDAAKPKDTLWAIEEALKCNALAAVVGEISELNFNDSRRLQLAVENSHVTGFIHRFRPKVENATACIARWKITSLESLLSDAAPGLGLSRWHVNLLKVKNGQPGNWRVQWSSNGLEYFVDRETLSEFTKLRTG